MPSSQLKIDLQHGVVPISRAAASIAALLKRSSANSQPIIITQKGYPTGVLLSIELYSLLRDRIAQAMPREAVPEPIAIPEPEPQDPPAAKRRPRKPVATAGMLTEVAPAEVAPAEVGSPTPKAKRSRSAKAEQEQPAD